MSVSTGRYDPNSQKQCRLTDHGNVAVDHRASQALRSAVAQVDRNVDNVHTGADGDDDLTLRNQLSPEEIGY